MPTGTAIDDVRERLFGAAETVLRRDGTDALTSRAVVAEAGCAKGVLHRHFADFDTFLADLVASRISRLGEMDARLRAAAGSATVAGNLAAELTQLFDSVALAMVALVTSRRGVLERLRATTPSGIPLLTEAAAMVSGYLAAERELGRIAADADVRVLAATLIGAGHLLFAGRVGDPPGADEVERTVTAALAGSLP